MAAYAAASLTEQGGSIQGIALNPTNASVYFFSKLICTMYSRQSFHTFLHTSTILNRASDALVLLQLGHLLHMVSFVLPHVASLMWRFGQAELRSAMSTAIGQLCEQIQIVVIMKLLENGKLMNCLHSNVTQMDDQLNFTLWSRRLFHNSSICSQHTTIMSA